MLGKTWITLTSRTQELVSPVRGTETRRDPYQIPGNQVSPKQASFVLSGAIEESREDSEQAARNSDDQLFGSPEQGNRETMHG